MKVGILTYFPFPKGMAPTTRIIAYSKALQKNGAEVEVFSCRWNPDNQGIPLSGKVEGVQYYNSHLWHTKYGKLFKVLIDGKLLRYKTILNIRKSHQIKPFDIFLVACDDANILKHYLPKIQSYGIPMVFVIDEYPPAIQELKNDVPEEWIDSFKTIDKYFAGRVLMTEALRNFYNSRVSMLPSHIMCSILDEDRFFNITPHVEERKYLCYMGNLMLKKDDVCTMIKAFDIIKDRFPDLDFHLYGNENTKEEGELVRSLIEKLNLKDRVYLRGRVDYHMVPSILAGATLLVTAQPKTKRAEGGFPTKMGEYMMSKIPMVVTNVGEISKYVTDRENCYMVEPENPQKYAETLISAIEQRETSKIIAQNAYKIANETYSSKHVGRNLLSFLNKLTNK